MHEFATAPDAAAPEEIRKLQCPAEGREEWLLDRCSTIDRI